MSGFLDDIPGQPLRPSKQQADQVNCVTYTIPRCPECKSPRCPTTNSDGPLKYRRCSDCGKTFKSFVMNWDKRAEEISLNP